MFMPSIADWNIHNLWKLVKDSFFLMLVPGDRVTLGAQWMSQWTIRFSAGSKKS